MASRAEHERVKLDCAVLEAKRARLQAKIPEIEAVIAEWERIVRDTAPRVAALRERAQGVGQRG